MLFISLNMYRKIRSLDTRMNESFKQKTLEVIGPYSAIQKLVSKVL